MTQTTEGFDFDGVDEVLELTMPSFPLESPRGVVVSALPGITSRHIDIGNGGFRYIPPRID